MTIDQSLKHDIWSLAAQQDNYDHPNVSNETHRAFHCGGETNFDQFFLSLCSSADPSIQTKPVDLHDDPKGQWLFKSIQSSWITMVSRMFRRNICTSERTLNSLQVGLGCKIFDSIFRRIQRHRYIQIHISCTKSFVKRQIEMLDM